MKLSVNLFGVLLSVAILFGSSFVEAQSFGVNNGFGSNIVNSQKPKVSVALSTSFLAFGHGFTSFGTTIMPKITFPVSNKFSISTGVGYSTFFVGTDGENAFQSNQSSYGHIFVSGEYQLNDKISIRGTGYKTFNLSATGLVNDVNQVGYDFSSQGIIMDVEYKVTENFRINVGFEYREQNYPVYQQYNGFNNNSQPTNFMSPFSGFNHRSGMPF